MFRKPLLILVVTGTVLVLLCWRYADDIARFILHTPYTLQSSMDITAGRQRYEKLVLGVRVVNEVRETDLSRLYRSHVGKPPRPVWRMTSAFVAGVDSNARVDGVYSIAQGDGGSLAGWLGEDGLFTTDAKRAVLLEFFALLQRFPGDPEPAHQYVNRIRSLVTERYEGKRGTIGVDDLPHSGYGGLGPPQVRRVNVAPNLAASRWRSGFGCRDRRPLPLPDQRVVPEPFDAPRELRSHAPQACRVRVQIPRHCSKHLCGAQHPPVGKRQVRVSGILAIVSAYALRHADHTEARERRQPRHIVLVG